MRKYLYLFIGLCMALLAKDMVMHHLLRQTLISELLKQNGEVIASDIALSLWPIGDANVTVKDVHVLKGKTLADIDQIIFRIPLLSLRTVRLNAQNIKIAPTLQSQQFIGEVVIGREQLTLTIGQFMHTAVGLETEVIAAPSIHLDGTYAYKVKDLFLNLNIPNININENSGMALMSTAKLTLTRPVIGGVDLRVRGLRQLLKVLVIGNYLREKDLPLLMMGAQLLGGKSQEVPLSLSFTAEGIFLGPIRIAAPL